MSDEALRKVKADALRQAAKEIAELVPYGYGMNPDGTEDRTAMAYVDGHREAWQALMTRADRIENGEQS